MANWFTKVEQFGSIWLILRVCVGLGSLVVQPFRQGNAPSLAEVLAEGLQRVLREICRTFRING